VLSADIGGEDKDQYSCFVNVKGRTLDVMVLSQESYIIKLPFSSKNKDSDPVEILVKSLTRTSEPPIGNPPIFQHLDRQV